MRSGNQNDIRARVVAISLSVVIGVALMLAKFYAYRLTHSSAIFSDALESIINVVAGAFALVSILFAAKPPDKSHPYGHGKMEYFSAGFEGALIIIASVGIFKLGLSHIFNPARLPQLPFALLILAGVGLVNLALGIGLVKVGRRTHSLALTADGRHILTDVYTSGALVLGLFLVHLTGVYWLDGLIACLVGVNILFSGAKLVRQSFAGLMDKADPDLMERIGSFLIEHREDDWIDVHQLRAWLSGAFVHMDFHLILPRYLSLEEAHREGKQLEKALIDHFQGRASVLIHLDPCADPDCPVCANHICGLRSEDYRERVPWDLKRLTRPGAAGGNSS
ncbi:MAG: cation transporter [Deltaproteobacteria bacterium]|nr:cation transporter [Deltaproteobacteria bacterium]